MGSLAILPVVLLAYLPAVREAHPALIGGTMRRVSQFVVVLVTALVVACEQPKGPAPAAPPPAPQPAAPDGAAAAAAAKEKEALEAAIDAYVYAYPLVTMELTRRASTNVVKPEGPLAPMGQFAKLREYPAPAMHTVTAPNADTLYTIVWLDVSKEPWVLGFPDMKGRYYLMPMLDGFTNVFADPGKRTTGTGPQKYAVTGPGWTGTLPPGVKELKSPTGMVWVLGRIYCTGTSADYKAVHALQDKFTAEPLSAYGKPYTPTPGVVDTSIDSKAAVRDQVERMDAAAFFKLFASLLRANPPSAEDAPMVAKLAQIGIVPGQEFDAAKLDPAVAKVLPGVPKAAQQKIMAWFKEAVVAKDAVVENGWFFTLKAGLYGTNYIQRALVTAIGLGANRPQDAVYPTSEEDGAGKPYLGTNPYLIHFPKGQLPPVNGFWSLTLYDAQFFFYPNKLGRQTLSQRDRLKVNKDGSVDLYVQNASPGKDKESNWLPAPPDKFVLMFRLYWPKEKSPSLLDGTWKLPAVTQAR